MEAAIAKGEQGGFEASSCNDLKFPGAFPLDPFAGPSHCRIFLLHALSLGNITGPTLIISNSQ
jgi:hypothetical protein